MIEFTNREAIQVITPALVELSRLPLPIKGALRVRKIMRVFTENTKIVEETRLEGLKKYVELTEKGEIAWLDTKDDKGRILSRESVYLKTEGETDDTTAREAWNAEFAELMGETFEWDERLTLQLRHFPRDDSSAKNVVSANLLFRLGDLVEDIDKKEKKP